MTCFILTSQILSRYRLFCGKSFQAIHQVYQVFYLIPLLVSYSCEQILIDSDLFIGRLIPASILAIATADEDFVAATLPPF